MILAASACVASASRYCFYSFTVCHIPFGLSLSKPWRAGVKSILGLRAEAGTRPGGRGTCSLPRQRKVPKRKATPSLRPLRCATGQTCVGAVAGCAVELALRWRAPLGQPRRVSSRSMRAPTRMLTPQPPRRRRSQQGGGQPNIHTGHCCARPRLRSAWRLRPRDGAEQSDGPDGCSLGSLLDAPGARSEFCGAPRDRAPQVAPQRSEGVAGSRVALSLVTFFRRRERKLLACRATPGLRP